MNTFLLKIKEPSRENDNIYIIQSNDLVKVGYTANLQSRMLTYYYHNPNTIFIGSAYREDAVEFERKLHSCVQAEVLNEWYNKDKLNLLIEYITNVIELPDAIVRVPKVNTLRTKATYKKGDRVSDKTLAKQNALKEFLTANPKGSYPLYQSVVAKELQYSVNQFGANKKAI